MSAPQSLPVAVLVLALLVLQISGLHYHRHLEAPEAASAHPLQLHIEDAGVHTQLAQPEHVHAAPGMADVHAHVDIETKVLDSGLVKLLKPLLEVVFAVLLLWLAPLLSPAGNCHPRRRFHPPLLRRRYALRPPINAPPFTTAAVV